MKKNTFKDFFYDRNYAIILLIGLIVTLTVPPIARKTNEIRLEKNGVIAYGQVIGTWQIPKRQPFAVYIFPVDSIYYRTGTFSFPRGSIVEEGDRVRVKYLEKNPEINRAVEFIVDYSFDEQAYNK